MHIEIGAYRRALQNVLEADQRTCNLMVGIDLPALPVGMDANGGLAHVQSFLLSIGVRLADDPYLALAEEMRDGTPELHPWSWDDLSG